MREICQAESHSMFKTRKPNSNREWEQWGKIDPLWAVSTWKGKEKGGDAPWTDEDFYKVGERTWESFYQHWKRYGLDKASCLEIGCGAGRMTMSLSKDFQTTHAIDVSKGMIDYARERIKLPSVHFYISDGSKIPLPDCSVSAVFSCEVFQHFDCLSHATVYFSEISRVLLPNGSLMIHLPIYNWPTMPPVSKEFNILFSFRQYIENLKAQIWRQFNRTGLTRPCMRGLSFPASYVFETLPKYKLTNLEILFFPLDDTICSAILAQKSPG